MAVISIVELLDLAQDSFDKAKEAATAIKLSLVREFAEAKHYAREKSARIGARLLAREPGIGELETYRGLKAWSALLSFDLRKSSELAVNMSARDMYVIVHTYLPTMLAIVDQTGGIVVGLRGDGAIAAFGLIEVGEGMPPLTKGQTEKAVTQACDCGDAIVKAMTKIVNPVLKKGGVEIKIQGINKLQVGVGIDVGEIVATKIGLGEAHELTAYGTAVNHCCKRSFGNDTVILTQRAMNAFPTKKGGKTTFPRYTGREDAYVLRYPDTYETLG